MTEEEKQTERRRQFRNRCYALGQALQDLQQEFYLVAPDLWSVADRFVLVEDVFEILKRDMEKLRQRVDRCKELGGL